MSIGAQMRERRKREGLSLREAAAASGISFATFQRMENGCDTSHKVAQRVEAWLNGEAPLLPTPPMTLRDWFAGQIVSASRGFPTHPIDQSRLAARCYEIADAMLAERAKATQP